MKVSINREILLGPLQAVCSVIERRQTLPILSNILIQFESDSLTLTGTDLEVEMVTKIALPDDAQLTETGDITLPAKKFLDIVKTLPENVDIKINIEKERAEIRSGRSRFVLATLAADEFPSLESLKDPFSCFVKQSELKHLLDKTQFSMAQQDVRYYLNGLLLELNNDNLRAVATDGHRLALCDINANISIAEPLQVIIPRKGVTELTRLLSNTDDEIELQVSNNHIKATLPNFTFTSKLIDGKFPDYEKVIPKNLDISINFDRVELHSALQRASVLSNEKYRGMRLTLKDNLLKATVNNPEQDEAEEEMEIVYSGEALDIGFNVSYFLDALNAIENDTVNMNLLDSNSSCLLQTDTDSDCKYVIMPMRL
ncbi:MAG: DNA polymerase III subunit beta [Gammaproteobacteria bacterium]